MTNKFKTTFKNIIDIFFLLLLLFLTVATLLSLLGMPSKESLQLRSLKVVNIRCSEGKGYKSLLLNVDVKGEVLSKILKPIKDCSDKKYGYIAGQTVDVLWSDENKLSIWQASVNNNQLTIYQETRNQFIKDKAMLMVVCWSIFGFVFFVRRFKRHNRKLKEGTSNILT